MLGSALAQVVEILMGDVIDGPHVILHYQSIFETIKVELFDGLIERQTFEDTLINQILLEVNGLAALDISVVLNHIDEVDDHLRLRPVQVRALMNPRDVVGQVLGEIGVHPHPYLPTVADKDHFLTDVEVAHLLVQHLEAMQRSLQQAELVSERDVVDLLQPQVYLLQVQQSLVHGGAKVYGGSVEEVLDLVDVGREAEGVFGIIFSL